MDEYQIIQKLTEGVSKIDQFKEHALSTLEKISDLNDFISDKQSKLEIFNTIFPNIESIKEEINREVSNIIKTINDSYLNELKKINVERTEIISKLDESLNYTKNQDQKLVELTTSLTIQNEKLKDFELNSSDYIKKYNQAINQIQFELSTIKDNFDLKYTYNKKRIIFTSFASLFLLGMIITSAITTFFMFAYASRAIFFPNRMDTLVIGILMLFLTLLLISLLIIIMYRPPVFLKKYKKNKHVEVNKNETI